MYHFEPKPKNVSRKENCAEKLSIAPLNPLAKEEQYIKKKERLLKKELLEKTLLKFRDNSKISPFDLNLDNHYKIKTKLNFFLVDRNCEKNEKRDKHCQVSDFMKLRETVKNGKINDMRKFRKENFFQLKKTGRDQGVQLDSEEIFDCEKALIPILENLKTKILEQSLLEVRQEKELENLKNIKINYFLKNKKRLQKQNNEYFFKEKKVLLDKKIAIQNDNKFLVKKEKVNKKNFFLEVSKFLINNVIQKVNITKNAYIYPHEEKKFSEINFYQNYKDWLYTKTTEIMQQKSHFQNSFENYQKPPITFETKLVEQKEKSITFPNCEKDSCFLQIFDVNSKQPFIYNFFSVYEQYINNNNLDFAKETFMENYQDSLDLTDLTKNKEMINITSFDKLIFRFSHNLFEKVPNQYKLIQPYILINDKEGKILYSFNLYNTNKYEFLKVEKNSFSFLKKENWDLEGELLLSKIRDIDIRNVVFFLKMENIENFNEIPDEILDIKFQILFNNEIIKKLSISKKYILEQKKLLSKQNSQDETQNKDENPNNSSSQKLIIKTDLILFFDKNIFLDYENHFSYLIEDWLTFLEIINRNVFNYSFPVDTNYLYENWKNEDFYYLSQNRSFDFPDMKKFQIDFFCPEKIEFVKNQMIENVKLFNQENFLDNQNEIFDSEEKIPFLVFCINRKFYFEDQNPNLFLKFLQKKMTPKNFHKIKIGLGFKNESEENNQT